MEQSFSNFVAKVFEAVVVITTTIVILAALTILVEDFKAIVDYLHAFLHPYSLPELKQVNFNSRVLFLLPFTLVFSD